MTATTLTFAVPAREPTLAICAGRVLALAGTTFGAANMIQWGILGGALPWHPAVLSVTWPAAIAVFFVVLFRLRRAGGETARRVAGWSRKAILIQIGVALALLGASAATGNWDLMRWTSVVGLSLYGLAWAVAAMRTAGPNMGLVSLTAFTGVAGMVARIGAPDQYLIHALALGLVALLPGLWLASGRRL